MAGTEQTALPKRVAYILAMACEIVGWEHEHVLRGLAEVAYACGGTDGVRECNELAEKMLTKAAE